MAEEFIQNNFFNTEHLKADLKGRSVRGGAITITAQGLKFFLQMGSTMILARLLTPQDYGLIAMVTAVTGFVMMFKDMGLSMATVQRTEISHSQISTLFWINVVLSLVIMLVTAALAPAIAWFYHEPRLTWITLVLAGAFIFSGLTVQHQALLRRQMRFRPLAIIEIVSMSSGIIVAMIAAYYGASYWSLVIMQLAAAIINAIGVWVVCGWRPGLPERRSGIREILAFGGNLTGFNFVNYFARNLDNVLIGRFCGSGPLGLYSKAYSLLMLPLRQINAPISAVAIPALSRLQDNPQRYQSYYCRALNFIAYLTTPLIIALAVVSKEVIWIVLGPEWLDAAPIFTILAIAGIGQPISNTVGWIYVSSGQVNRQLYWALISLPVLVLAFVIGLQWGVLGVATSYAICCHLIRVPSWWFAFRYSPIKMRDLFNAIWRPMALSVVMASAMMVTRSYLMSRSSFLILVCSCTVGLLVLISGSLFWPGARKESLEIAKNMSLLMPARHGT